MFILLVCLILNELVLSQHILGVTYSFDVDFERTFNKCEGKDMWHLVNYEYIGINAPYNSDKGIQAVSNSCTSSFPIIFIPGSTLDVSLYVRAVSKDSGVVISVLNENRETISRYIYNRSSKDYVAGWTEISLPIKVKGVGYINLLGNSQENEIVLIDSFKYTPNQTQFEDDKAEDDSDTLIFIGQKETKYLEETVTSGDHENDFDGSGEVGNDIDDPLPSELTATIGPWAIALIAIGGWTVLSLIVVSAYHVGKNRGMAQNPLLHIEDAGPPKFPMIPRVRGATVTPNERIRSLWYD